MFSKFEEFLDLKFSPYQIQEEYNDNNISLHSKRSELSSVPNIHQNSNSSFFNSNLKLFSVEDLLRKDARKSSRRKQYIPKSRNNFANKSSLSENISNINILNISNSILAGKRLYEDGKLKKQKQEQLRLRERQKRLIREVTDLQEIPTILNISKEIVLNSERKSFLDSSREWILKRNAKIEKQRKLQRMKEIEEILKYKEHSWVNDKNLPEGYVGVWEGYQKRVERFKQKKAKSSYILNNESFKPTISIHSKELTREKKKIEDRLLEEGKKSQQKLEELRQQRKRKELAELEKCKIGAKREWKTECPKDPLEKEKHITEQLYEDGLKFIQNKTTSCSTQENQDLIFKPTLSKKTQQICSEKEREPLYISPVKKNTQSIQPDVSAGNVEERKQRANLIREFVNRNHSSSNRKEKCTKVHEYDLECEHKSKLIYCFKPTLLPLSNKIIQDLRFSQNKDNPSVNELFETLYHSHDHVIQKRKELKEELEQERESRIAEACTFAPVIKKFQRAKTPPPNLHCYVSDKKSRKYSLIHSRSGSSSQREGKGIVEKMWNQLVKKQIQEEEDEDERELEDGKENVQSSPEMEANNDELMRNLHQIEERPNSKSKLLERIIEENVSLEEGEITLTEINQTVNKDSMTLNQSVTSFLFLSYRFRILSMKVA
jgi:hypothetical protein